MKTMNTEEMKNFIKKIGRGELYDEIKLLKNKNIDFPSLYSKYPKYLKAVKVTLIALDYDAEWVECTFTKELEKEYLK